MASTSKVAISLPDALVRKVERMRKATGESRSAIFRRGLELIIAEEERTARLAAYVEGYRRSPETEGEVAAAMAAASELLAGEPWD